MAEQIAEYEGQLANIEELLKEAPADESLLALKNDILELLQLTKNEMPQQNVPHAIVEPDEGDLSLPPPPVSEPPPMEVAIAAGQAAASVATEDDKPSVQGEAASKKKIKKLKDFVVPPHLIVTETDSEADKKKKRRALKALKSQHREKRKEVEHEQKQKSWQSFQKKKKTGGDSMFATKDSVNDRVGVVSRKTKTDFGSKKRHKPL